MLTVLAHSPGLGRLSYPYLIILSSGKGYMYPDKSGFRRPFPYLSTSIPRCHSSSARWESRPLPAITLYVPFSAGLPLPYKDRANTSA